MSVFEFDADFHVYTLDGEELPSVTQILEAAGIIDYSHIPWNVRHLALERGRAVHAATELDDRGDLDETTLDPMLEGHLAAWRRFRAETGFTPTLIEHRDYHRLHRYAGTIDRLGNFNGGRAAVLDIKTNHAEPWVRLQLAAYSEFAGFVYERVCVELHADGTYRTFTFPVADRRRDLNDFLACLRVMQLKAELKGSL